MCQYTDIEDGLVFQKKKSCPEICSRTAYFIYKLLAINLHFHRLRGKTHYKSHQKW